MVEANTSLYQTGIKTVANIGTKTLPKRYQNGTEKVGNEGVVGLLSRGGSEGT